LHTISGKSADAHLAASALRHRCSATSHVLSGCNSGIHARTNFPSDDFASGDAITSSKAQQFGLAEDSRRTIGQLEIHLAAKLGVKCCTAANVRPDLWP